MRCPSKSSEVATLSQEKRCSICRRGSMEIDSELFLGPWMQKSGITVHYYCLLLSTHLPQEGEECGGIYGFLLRDIRAEIAAAGKRFCIYCDKIGASIRCDRCKCYFDIRCGVRNHCIFQFVGEFKSICNGCIILDSFQKRAKKHWKRTDCYICKEFFGNGYMPTEQLYAPCCKNGFIHRNCMQQYALSSGYYLRCIFCRSTSFRESIKLQGIFVPDREAKWETRAEFRDLHRGHCRCDVENCLCKRGREYKSKRWNLINCNFCGSFGVHYPICVPKLENGKFPSIEEFRCEICGSTENNAFEKTMRAKDTENVADYFDLYIHKSRLRTNNVQGPASSTHKERQFPEHERHVSLRNAHPQNTSNAENTVVTSTTAVSSVLNDNEISWNSAIDTERISTQTFCAPSSTECDSSNNIVDISKTDDSCDFEEIEMIDFNKDFEIVGTCKLRINMNSPRFANKSLPHIVNNLEILRQSDIVEQTGDIMPFEKVKYLLGGKAGDEFLSRHCPK